MQMLRQLHYVVAEDTMYLPVSGTSQTSSQRMHKAGTFLLGELIAPRTRARAANARADAS